jgi:Ribbon-helix-helix protein, copG family
MTSTIPRERRGTQGEGATMNKYTDGGGIDLDQEVVRRKDGSRLDEVGAEQLGQEILKRAGRPSLSGGSKRSPQIGVRLPDDLHDRLQNRADREGKRLSQVVRDAVEAYL